MPRHDSYRLRATLLLATLAVARAVLAAPDALTLPAALEVRRIEGEEVRFRSGDTTLYGRLWLPAGEGPFSGLVFIPGSGRSICDLHLDPRPLPHRLGADGIALLAFDKRGVRHSEGTFEPLSDTDPGRALARLRLLASDASAAVHYLRGRAEIVADRVGVYAFSQGGWVAALLDEVASDAPRAAVVVGGPAVSIAEELEFSRLADQARAAADGDSGAVDLDELYAAHHAASRPGPASVGGYGPRIFDPLPFLRASSVPSLWLLGERDLSVPTRRSVEILAGLEAVGRPVRHRVLEGAQHGGWIRDEHGAWVPSPDERDQLLRFFDDTGMLPTRIAVDVRLDEAPGG